MNFFRIVALTSIIIASGRLYPAAAAACQVDAIQLLFTQRAANAAEIAPMLDACVATGSTDPRIPLFRGVLARDRGDLALSKNLLAQARAADSHSVPAILESAVTEERLLRYDAADGFYRAALQLQPNSRAGLLGRARIAGFEHRDTDAETLYRHLLAGDAHDADALAGLGWLSVDRQEPKVARSFFEQTLAVDPGNADAQAGLAATRLLWRNRLVLAGGWINAVGGDAWSSGALFTTRAGAADSIELGILHNSNELAGVGFTDQRLLPLDDYHIGWNRDAYRAVSWSVDYDNRTHASLPSEQWLSGSIGVNAATNVHVFATYRATFGAPEWDGYLVSLGTAVDVGHGWAVQATGFAAGYRTEPAINQFGPMMTANAASLDVQRQAGSNGFSAGLGYNPKIGSIDEHLRAVIPLSSSTALTIAASHQTVIPQTQVFIGSRFSW